MTDECPECGGLIRLGWTDGTRVCVNGHRWTADLGACDKCGDDAIIDVELGNFCGEHWAERIAEEVEAAEGDR